MIRNLGDEGPQTKKGGDGDGGCGGGGGSCDGDGRTLGATVGVRSWTGLRDSRIVRVCRSLGGKDRHSKVSTIRGLRDRRVRLSVPTALQLYDLQDKLGLSQPSKAVDWLLHAAQQEIDKLPPLQIPPGCFIQYPPSAASPRGAGPPQPHSGPALVEEMEFMKENGSGSVTLAPGDRIGVQTGVLKPTHWSEDQIPLRAKWKEHTRGAMDEKDGRFRRTEKEHHDGEVQSTVVPVHPSMTSMAGDNNLYASYYYNLEGSNIRVTHLGGYAMPQTEDTHGYRPQQLVLCPSGTPMATLSPHAAASTADFDPKHVSSFHMGPSTSQGPLSL